MHGSGEWREGLRAVALLQSRERGRRAVGAEDVAQLGDVDVDGSRFLVDGKGNERASLVADDAGSVFLVMFDSKGKTRSQLSVSNDGPSLIFYDASGQPRLIAGSTTSVGSHVNENGIAEKAPASSIIIFDKAGKLLWREP